MSGDKRLLAVRIQPRILAELRREKLEGVLAVAVNRARAVADLEVGRATILEVSREGMAEDLFPMFQTFRLSVAAWQPESALRPRQQQLTSSPRSTQTGLGQMAKQTREALPVFTLRVRGAKDQVTAGVRLDVESIPGS